MQERTNVLVSVAHCLYVLRTRSAQGVEEGALGCRIHPCQRASGSDALDVPWFVPASAALPEDRRGRAHSPAASAVRAWGMCLALMSPGEHAWLWGPQAPRHRVLAAAVDTEGDRLIFPILRLTSRVPPVRLVAASSAERQLLPCRHADACEGEQRLGEPRLFLMQLDSPPGSRQCPETLCPEPARGSLPTFCRGVFLMAY